MSNSDREILRHALAAALNQLDADGPDRSDPIAICSDPHTSTSSSTGQTPVVVVYLRGTQPLSQEAQTPTSGLTTKGTPSDNPSLGRFAFPESPTVSNAPKTCFIEPGRVCVNSGACEALGY